jgi:hypothetical protein
MRSLDDAPAVIGVLGLGNSLMATGFDPKMVEQTFQSAHRPLLAVNGALGATDPIEHLLLLRLVLRKHTVRQLVYGFFDQQLSNDPELANGDLIGNHAMLYYQEPEVVLQYARFNWVDLIAFQTFRCCALFRERGTIWTKVEKLRRAMGSVGMPHQASNRFGRPEDFDLLEFVSPAAFTERCNQVIQSGQILSPPIQELFKEAAARGVRIAVVEMPMHPWHVKTFYDLPAWKELRRVNQQAVESLGASYIDASHWIPSEDQFQDHVHLGPTGAAQFSRLLADRLLGAAPSPVASTR